MIQENGGSTMLVLSRKFHESVVVGGIDEVTPLLKITILEIKGGKVRLGFEADGDLPVHRLEVWERIRAAVQPDTPLGGAAKPVV